MKNVKTKNRLRFIFYLLPIMFVITGIYSDVTEKLPIVAADIISEDSNDSLVLDILFEDLKECYMPYDSIDWNEIDLDKGMTVKWFMKNEYITQKIVLKHNLVALKIPLLFSIKLGNDNTISLVTSQLFNTVWADSLVLRRIEGIYYPYKAYTIGYGHNVEPEIIPIDFVYEHGVVNMTSIRPQD